MRERGVGCRQDCRDNECCFDGPNPDREGHISKRLAVSGVEASQRSTPDRRGSSFWHLGYGRWEF